MRETPATFEEEPPSTADFAERIEAAARTHAWLVLERDDEVIGFAYASPHRTRAAYRWAADVAVYIDPGHHRLGAGRRLYEALFELLRRQGIQVLCAGVTLPNEASVGLHEALGFERVATYPAIGWKHGAWHDVGWFSLRLAPATDEPPAEPLGRQRLD